jgi:hypothetical protein
MRRRDLLRGVAALAPASFVLGHYSALAAPLRKKVKITDLKVMVVGRHCVGPLCSRHPRFQSA